MKRVKNTIALLIALVVLVFLLYKSYPYMEVSYYNRYINASGVKLNMMEEEVFEELGQEGEFVPGMGGHGNFFTKGNVYVQLVYYVELSGVTVVSRLRIGIEDPAYKDVVF